MREKERGRDNRHSRHIKTQQGDTAKASSTEQTDSRGAGYAVGLHSGVTQAAVFKV